MPITEFQPVRVAVVRRAERAVDALLVEALEVVLPHWAARSA